MTIEERKQAILAKIAEIKQGGSDEEKQDMRAALDLLGVTNEDESNGITADERQDRGRNCNNTRAGKSRAREQGLRGSEHTVHG